MRKKNPFFGSVHSEWIFDCSVVSPVICRARSLLYYSALSCWVLILRLLGLGGAVRIHFADCRLEKMTLKNILTYLLFSFHLFSSVAYFAYMMREDDLYPTLVYLVTAPIPVCTLINLYIALLLAASAVLVKLFLGHLMPNEIHSVSVNFLLKGFDAVVVLMTVFVYGIKLDLAKPVVPILFTGLMLARLMHWIAGPRVDSLGLQDHRQVETMTKVRVGLLLVVLVLVDIGASLFCFQMFQKAKKPFVMFHFAFDFTLLSIMALAQLGIFSIFLFDWNFSAKHNQPWGRKVNLLYCVKLLYVGIHAGIFISMFLYAYAQFIGHPIYLLRELFVTMYWLYRTTTEYFQS
jgi:hypothetical protein